jgi:hypothetical protein
MTKNYSKNVVSKEILAPTESTIQFLLNYSKSLSFMDSKIVDDKIELNLN